MCLVARWCELQVTAGELPKIWGYQTVVCVTGTDGGVHWGDADKDKSYRAGS